LALKIFIYPNCYFIFRAYRRRCACTCTTASEYCWESNRIEKDEMLWSNFTWMQTRKKKVKKFSMFLCLHIFFKCFNTFSKKIPS